MLMLTPAVPHRNNVFHLTVLLSPENFPCGGTHNHESEIMIASGAKTLRWTKKTLSQPSKVDDDFFQNYTRVNHPEFQRVITRLPDNVL